MQYPPSLSIVTDAEVHFVCDAHPKPDKKRVKSIYSALAAVRHWTMPLNYR